MNHAVHDGRRLIGAWVRALVIGALALSPVACGKPEPEAGRAAAAPSAATDTTASTDSLQVGAAAADTGWTETGTQVIGEFVPVTGGSPRTVQTLAVGGDDPGYDESPELIATVGPYAFIFVRTYESPCGAAHPGTGVHFHVLDLAAGRSLEPLELLDGGERERWIRELGSRAVAAFRARETDSLGSPPPFQPDSVEVTALLPSYAGGRLALSAQFTSGACYACSDGRWGSYSVSERIAAPVPAALERYAETPLAVTAFFGLNPPDSGGGWSRAGDTLVVWRRAAHAETAWLLPQGRGFGEARRRPGVTVYAGNQAWTWRERALPLKGPSCEELLGDTLP